MVRLLASARGWCCALCLVSAAVFAGPDSIAFQPEVRLLVDVSDGMRDAGPGNLRTAALELAVRLLPEGARAGVWAFAGEVEELVPVGTVDRRWRDEALRAVARLGHSDWHSDIPAALAATLADLEQPDNHYHTSIILLTAGRVAVAASPMVNAGAARSLLASLAPQLGANGIPVYAIALSDDADRAFLGELARTTGGIAEDVRSPEDLPGSVVRVLEMAAPRPQVPVEDGGFAIDRQVDSFTALLFHRDEGIEPALVAPDGTRYTSGERAAGMAWLDTPRFTLATVSAPQPGRWQLSPPDAARARILVEAGPLLEAVLPRGSLDAGQSAELSLRVTGRDAAADASRDRDGYSVTIDIRDPGGDLRHIAVRANKAPTTEEIYRVALPALERPGRYRLLVRLHGASLQRELPLFLDVAAPPDLPTLVTRGTEPADDRLRLPLVYLGVTTLLLLALVWLILRRRRRQQLELWRRRAQQLRADGDAGMFRIPAESIESTSGNG